jgi:AAA+ ATPase superfamily predicted ATPase
LAGDIILTECRRRPLRPAPSSSSFTPLSGRITDPDRVFDRGRELAQALDLLRVGSSVALIGPAGVGKSSLLTLLTARVREELGPSWEAVYLDLQRLANEEQFREALCERLHVPTCRGLALQKALEGRRVLLCLDEVEKLSWDDDGFTRGLRAELRGLAEGPDAPLKLALAARTSLDRLFPDSAGETSPLANICLQVDVGPWDEATARDFLLDRLGGTGVRFTEAESARLVTESGGYPMKLMRAAHRLYGERTGGVR